MFSETIASEKECCKRSTTAVASFPGPAQLSVKAMESWAGTGNEATTAA